MLSHVVVVSCCCCCCWNSLVLFQGHMSFLDPATIQASDLSHRLVHEGDHGKGSSFNPDNYRVSVACPERKWTPADIAKQKIMYIKVRDSFQLINSVFLSKLLLGHNMDTRQAQHVLCLDFLLLSVIHFSGTVCFLSTTLCSQDLFFLVSWVGKCIFLLGSDCPFRCRFCPSVGMRLHQHVPVI